jgi:hypothetical protein
MRAHPKRISSNQGSFGFSETMKDIGGPADLSARIGEELRLSTCECSGTTE